MFNRFIPNKSTRNAILLILAGFLVFGGYAALDGDLQSPLIYGVFTSVVLAAICVINFVKETKKQRKG